jgi:hypothetical protein
VTVDRGRLPASDGLDHHAAYVAMSRHRQSLAVHFGDDDFRGRPALVRALSRERTKDTTLDYGEAFAARRGITQSKALFRSVLNAWRELGALEEDHSRIDGRRDD